MSLSDALTTFHGKTVAVIGDLMLDDYVWGRAARISPEAPVMVVDAQRETQVPGGAANVAHNVTSLGGNALLVGVIGDDDSGRILSERLQDFGVSSGHLVVDPSRTTTRKTRIIAHSQQVLRLDREVRGALEEPTSSRVLQASRAAIEKADAVVLSDYRKGCLNEARVRAVVSMARDIGKPCLANPKPTSLPWYAGADLVSVNRVEAEGFVGVSEVETEELLTLVSVRVWEAGLRNALITLGEEGMALCGAETARVEALRVEVYDTAGAGDTVIATMALASAAGVGRSIAMRIANLAAGCVVRHVGVAVTTPAELVSVAESHGYLV